MLAAIIIAFLQQCNHDHLGHRHAKKSVSSCIPFRASVTTAVLSIRSVLCKKSLLFRPSMQLLAQSENKNVFDTNLAEGLPHISSALFRCFLPSSSLKVAWIKNLAGVCYPDPFS
jgi:hypothetical protein